jgi:hypothetical protein
VDLEQNYASVSYKTIKSYRVITNGQDSFVLETGSLNDGGWY